jgi:hypothetical protein
MDFGRIASRSASRSGVRNASLNAGEAGRRFAGTGIDNASSNRI